MWVLLKTYLACTVRTLPPINFLLQICDTLDIYGVGTTAFKEKVPNWHYFENHRFHSSREFGSDPHHSFALEHEALLLLKREKVVIHHP